MAIRPVLTSLMIFLAVTGCAVLEKPMEKPAEAPKVPLILVSAGKIPFGMDDLDRESLMTAIERSLKYYEGAKENSTYIYSDRIVSARELQESLQTFREIISGPESDMIKWNTIVNTFDTYRAVGSGDNGTVFFTGYFEPVMEGSLERTTEYRYPIYRTPDDTVVVNLGRFNKKYGNEKIVGRVKDGEVTPHFTRGDIEKAGSLKGKNLELLWIKDPIDLFFLHIQGSGKIRLPDGRITQVSYAQSNGRPYRSIGKYLLDKGILSLNEITHQRLKKYLKEHPEELSDIFNYNESYVFFRIVENGPVGALGLTLTAGRSIATDLDLFPRGALAIIRLKKPVFDENGDIKKWESFSRFVLNQDTGGVIKGPGRVDLFCGSGTDAEMVAGSLKEKGELYFLLKKKLLQ